MSLLFYHKTGHQMRLQNVVYMRLDLPTKGLFSDLCLFAGNSELQDGSFPLGAVKRATVEDVILFFGDGTKAKRTFIERCINQLCLCGMVKLVKNVVVLSTYTAEQKLGATPETNRKREIAAARIEDKMGRVRDALRRLFASAHALPYEVVIGEVKRVVGGNRRTHDPIMQGLRDRGFLFISERGVCSLASLASPPVADSGLEAGSAGFAVSGAEHSGFRNIPLESELESDLEPEKETYVSPADPAGTRPRPIGIGHGSPRVGAGGGEASEARTSHARSSPDSEADLMLSPEDAWHVVDPVHAAQLLFEPLPGWQELRSEAHPSSWSSLLSKWSELREAFGANEADRIWRQALFDMMVSKLDRGKWRSWVAGFLGKCKVAAEVRKSLAEATV